MDTIQQRRLWALHLCGFALLIAGLAAVVGMAIRSEDAEAWVSHTVEVRRASGVLLSVLQDAEANVRAFLLTGDASLIRGYEAARTAVPDAEGRLRELSADNPPQLARLDALAPLIRRRLEGLSEAITAANKGELQRLAQRVTQRDGARLMAEIRASLGAFDQAEANLLAQREAAASHARMNLLAGSSGALSLALLLGGLTAFLGHRQARTLHAANAHLSGAISDRTAALRDSEARFGQVFHDIPLGLAIVIAESRRIIAANPALCRMLGYSEAELLGRVPQELAHPDDADLSVPVNTASEVSWRPVEKRYVTGSGAVVFTRACVVPLGFPSEREPLLLGISEDVTHEKEIEAALRDSETRLRLAVETAGLGLWEQDEERQAIRLDRRAAELVGGTLPTNTWLDCNGPELDMFEALIHPDDIAGRAAAEASLRASRTEMATNEFRLRRPDGSWGWLSAVGTIAERNPQTGQTLRVLTTLQDITQRKETELELRHAQRMEAIGQLTGGVAHDFNNLLGAILGHTEFLLDLLEERTEERELATEILDCTLNGAALTQRLLAFARRQPLQPAVIDLNKYLPAQVSMLQRTLGETVTVDVALTPGLSLTLADPSQIVDVLLNLAINARDAMPHGGRLTIATANATLDAAYCARNAEATPGDYVVLSVSDTGLGMTSDVLTRATEPFFTTKPPGKGSGLGLSTIYGFARQSGGHLSIHSAVGEGTTVRIYLPSCRAGPGATASALPLPPPLPRGCEAILVVDDNDAMRTTAAHNLAALGYRVRLAADGPAALAILQSGAKFQLLFTDLVMPNGLSGYELAETARALQPDLRVLFTTGFAVEDEGATAVMDPRALRKPYRRRELAERIRAILDEDAAG